MKNKLTLLALIVTSSLSAQSISQDKADAINKAYKNKQYKTFIKLNETELSRLGKEEDSIIALYVEQVRILREWHEKWSGHDAFEREHVALSEGLGNQWKAYSDFIGPIVDLTERIKYSIDKVAQSKDKARLKQEAEDEKFLNNLGNLIMLDQSMRHKAEEISDKALGLKKVNN
jgi:hypothetical protein